MNYIFYGLQMKILHMGGFNESELIQYRNAVRGNLVDAMCTVLRDMDAQGIEYEHEVEFFFVPHGFGFGFFAVWVVVVIHRLCVYSYEFWEAPWSSGER